MAYIGYIGGCRIDYQGYPTKGGVLPSDINQALEAMRKAKKRANRHPNARWMDNDYMEEIVEINGCKSVNRTIKMKNVWRGRL